MQTGISPEVSQLQQADTQGQPEQNVVPVCVADFKDFSLISFSSCFWDQSNFQGFMMES